MALLGMKFVGVRLENLNQVYETADEKTLGMLFDEAFLDWVPGKGLIVQGGSELVDSLWDLLKFPISTTFKSACSSN